MTRVVILAPDAQADLWRLADFLAPKSPAAAERAVKTIQDAVASLAKLAERGRPSPDRPNVRELVIKFSSAAYIAEYRIDEDRVTVIRIFHSREAR